MNHYSLERFGLDRSARLRKEAAVAVVVRASGAPTVTQAAAATLRRLAERLDRNQSRSARAVDVAQPTVMLARRAA